VGGLRTHVDQGETGFLVDSRDPAAYAEHVDRILDDGDLADRLSAAAVRRAGAYRWSTTAARLRRLYADLTVRAPVSC
jgi:D-inositol-3-phosphate glycosyltransferase